MEAEIRLWCTAIVLSICGKHCICVYTSVGVCVCACVCIRISPDACVVVVSRLRVLISLFVSWCTLTDHPEVLVVVSGKIADRYVTWRLWFCSQCVRTSSPVGPVISSQSSAARDAVLCPSFALGFIHWDLVN